MDFSRLRWFLLLILPILVISMAFSQPVIERTGSNQMVLGEATKIVINVVADGAFDLAELIPEGWEISSWNVEGNSTPVIHEMQKLDYSEKTKEAHHWKFEETDKTVTLTYYVIPTSSDDMEIITLSVYPGGFDSKTNEISFTSKTIRPQTQDFLPILFVLLLIIMVVLVVYKYLKKRPKITKEKPRVEQPKPKVQATTEKPVKKSKKPIKTKAKAEKTKEENDEIFDKTLQKLEKIKKQLK